MRGIKKISMAGIWAMLLHLAGGAAVAGASDFSMAPYLKECGGEVFPECEGKAEGREFEMVKAAEAAAIAAGERLVLLMGYYSAVDFGKAIQSLSPRLQDKVTFVAASLYGPSSRAIKERYNLEETDEPRLLIIDPRLQREVMAVGLGEFTDLTKGEGIDLIAVERFFQEMAAPPAATDAEEPSALILPAPGSVATADQNLQQGIHFLMLSQWNEALHAFHQARTENPQLTMAHVGASLALQGLGQFDQASELALMAHDHLLEGQSREGLWLTLAQTLLMLSAGGLTEYQEQFYREDFRAAYAQLMHQFPGDADGITYFGQQINCLECVEEALLVNPLHAGALRYLSEHGGGGLAQAEAFAAAAPQAPHAHALVGQAQMRLGNGQAALAAFAQADALYRDLFSSHQSEPALTPPFARNLIHYALAFDELADKERSKGLLQEVCSLYPSSAECLDAAGALVTAGEYAAANELLATAGLLTHPRFALRAQARMLQVEALLLQGDLAQARSQWHGIRALVASYPAMRPIASYMDSLFRQWSLPEPHSAEVRMPKGVDNLLSATSTSAWMINRLKLKRFIAAAQLAGHLRTAAAAQAAMASQ